MNHVPTHFATPSASRLATSPMLPEAPRSACDAPPFWTPARIDLARRLWSKGAEEADILVALARLPGPPDLSAHAIGALARRLCWPGPRQPPRPLVLVSRDGLPSMAERQAAELARAIDVVDLPLEDAVAWGRANGVPRLKQESDAALLARINRARAGHHLPRFRLSRPS